MTTLVMDLDGTICTQMKSGEYHLALPLMATITRLREFKKNKDNRVVIHTARGMNSFHGNVTECIQSYATMTHEWLQKHGVPYDELIFGKPPGDYYVDDKAMSREKFWRRFEPEPI